MHEPAFLQAVYNARQLRYEPPAYDLLTDSMFCLQEYADIESDAIDDRIDEGYLTHDTGHPHCLYSVPPAGRQVLKEGYRKGVDDGHGQGDLEESSEHVMAVEVGRRYLVQEFVTDPDSPVVEVIPYDEHDETEGSTGTAAAAVMGGEAVEEDDLSIETQEQRRLDVAGVDAEGTVRVALEAERVNNDIQRAVPADYDAMATCDVAEAIWIVMNRDAGHEVLNALNEPVEGEPRVEETYCEGTPPRQFSLDAPGCTAIYSIAYVRDTLLE